MNTNTITTKAAAARKSATSKTSKTRKTSVSDCGTMTAEDIPGGGLLVTMTGDLLDRCQAAAEASGESLEQFVERSIGTFLDKVTASLAEEKITIQLPPAKRQFIEELYEAAGLPAGDYIENTEEMLNNEIAETFDRSMNFGLMDYIDQNVSVAAAKSDAVKAVLAKWKPIFGK